MLGQSVDDGFEVEGGLAVPTGQGRAVELDALPAVDLRLPVERQMIGELADQDTREGCLGWQPGRDQIGRCLMHAFLACRAGVSRADGGDHPKLRWDDVEALGNVLADLDHGTTATRADVGANSTVS